MVVPAEPIPPVLEPCSDERWKALTSWLTEEVSSMGQQIELSEGVAAVDDALVSRLLEDIFFFFSSLLSSPVICSSKTVMGYTMAWRCGVGPALPRVVALSPLLAYLQWRPLDAPPLLFFRNKFSIIRCKILQSQKR